MVPRPLYLVGDHKGLVIPPLKRERQTGSRLKGLRLIHTHLKGEPLSQDDLMDLALLRLDFIVALEVTPQGLPGRLHGAHLLPQRIADRDWEFLDVDHVSHLDLDFSAVVQSLEAELARAGPVSALTRTGGNGPSSLVSPPNSARLLKIL